MNRLEKFESMIGNGDKSTKTSLLDVALDVHGQLCGSSDFRGSSEMNALVGALQSRIDDWTPSCSGSELFDGAVKTVVMAAIYEWKTSHLNVG